MDLSHQSITGREFELNRRGYDPDTVDAHLADIAAAVGEREREVAEMKATIESLEAKVRDADESEEALRLTLKAAAHAKEELLAGARQQAKTMEEEAAGKAETLVAEATADAETRVSEATTKALELTSAAEARVQAMEDGAQARAGEVAKAALAESEALVARIEGLRENLDVAERALSSLQSNTGSQIEDARVALDTALAGAREVVADPSMLVQSPPPEVTEPVQSAAVAESPAEEPAYEDEGQPVATDSEKSVDVAESAEDPVAPAVAETGVVEREPVPAPDAPPQDEAAPRQDEAVATEKPAAVDAPIETTEEVPAPAESAEDPAPHLEVVAPPDSADPEESSADISDKVDRLLEELREVT